MGKTIANRVASNANSISERARKQKKINTNPHRTRLGQEIENDVLDVRRIMPANDLERFGQIVHCRHAVTAQGDNEPGEHHQVFLLFYFRV